MKLWKNLLILGVSLAGLLLIGCEENESNDLAKAQRCLDQITSANYNDASLCMDYVAKYDSQQANILKCSILMVDGGLTTDKVTEAYKKLSTTSTTNEAAFISVLAMPSGKAAAALPYCERTGLKGLIYLANLAVVGSLMADTLAGIGYDPTNPTDIPDTADINQMIANCTPPAVSVPPCDQAAIGNAVVTLGSSYCTGSNATSDICTDLTDAITQNPGNSTNIAKELFCKFDPAGPKNYDPIGDNCI